MFLLIAPAFALSVDTVTAFEAAEGQYVSSVVAADGGNACFGAFGSDGSSALYTWDGASASVLAHDSDYAYCSAINDAGWLLTYEYQLDAETGMYSYSQALHDLLSGESVTLDNSLGTYVYANRINEAGEATGYVGTDLATRAAYWDHTGAGTLIESPRLYEYAQDIDDAGRVLLTGVDGGRYTSSLYDTVRGTRTELFASNVGTGFLQDGSVAIRQGRGFYHYDVRSGTTDDFGLGLTRYVSVVTSNHAGDVLLYRYGRFTTELYCWTEEGGAVPLDLGDNVAAYASAMNDAGTIVGYGYTADYTYSPVSWDCRTGAMTTYDIPEGYVGAYPQALTEAGQAVVWAWNGDYTYSVYVLDLSDGSTAAIEAEGGYVQLLGVAADAGQIFWSDPYATAPAVYVSTISG